MQNVKFVLLNFQRGCNVIVKLLYKGSYAALLSVSEAQAEGNDQNHSVLVIY